MDIVLPWFLIYGICIRQSRFGIPNITTTQAAEITLDIPWRLHVLLNIIFVYLQVPRPFGTHLSKSPMSLWTLPPASLSPPGKSSRRTPWYLPFILVQSLTTLNSLITTVTPVYMISFLVYFVIIWLYYAQSHVIAKYAEYPLRSPIRWLQTTPWNHTASYAAWTWRTPVNVKAIKFIYIRNSSRTGFGHKNWHLHPKRIRAVEA